MFLSEGRIQMSLKTKSEEECLDLRERKWREGNEKNNKRMNFLNWTL